MRTSPNALPSASGRRSVTVIGAAVVLLHLAGWGALGHSSVVLVSVLLLGLGMEAFAGSGVGLLSVLAELVRPSGGALALVAAVDLDFLGMAVFVLFGAVRLGSRARDRIRRDGRPVPVRG